MKKGWEYKKLGEVCDLYQPKTISTKEMVSDGLYDVFGANGKIGKYHSYNHEDSEILMTCRGATCGNINISTPKSWINGNAMVVHIKDEEKLDRQFLVYSLINIDKSHIITGAAQPQITRQTLSPLQICFPSLPEQQSIVDYLDSAFAKIDAMKANAEKTLNEAKDLFQASLKEMLEPKEGWEEKKFGDVCWYNRNNGIHKGTRYVGMEHIEQGTGSLLDTISSDDVLSNTFAFSKGDVLYGRLRPYLKKVIVADFDGCCSTEIFPIQSKDIVASFLMYWFLTDEITNKINATCAGCRMPRGNMNDVLKFNISYPSIAEQQSIVTTLDSLKSKVDRLQANYDKISQECDALKQAILRQVFE